MKTISIWILVTAVINAVAICMEVSTVSNFKSFVTLSIPKTRRISFKHTGEVVPAPGLSFCQWPWTWSITSPHSIEQEDVNNTSSKRRGEGRSCLSAHHCKSNGFHLWRTAWRIQYLYVWGGFWGNWVGWEICKLKTQNVCVWQYLRIENIG